MYTTGIYIVGSNNCGVVFQSTMFSSLASYLLGTQTHEPDLSPETATADVRLRAVDGDDDWVLVETAGKVFGNFQKQLGRKEKCNLSQNIRD
jgi:hypothetical protein